MRWFRRNARPVPPLMTATQALAMVRSGHRVEVVTALVDPRQLPAFRRGLGSGGR